MEMTRNQGALFDHSAPEIPHLMFAGNEIISPSRIRLHVKPTSALTQLAPWGPIFSLVELLRLMKHAKDKTGGVSQTAMPKDKVVGNLWRCGPEIFGYLNMRNLCHTHRCERQIKQAEDII
jgi:hypothetical protein